MMVSYIEMHLRRALFEDKLFVISRPMEPGHRYPSAMVIAVKEGNCIEAHFCFLLRDNMSPTVKQQLCKMSSDLTYASSFPPTKASDLPAVSNEHICVNLGTFPVAEANYYAATLYRFWKQNPSWELMARPFQRFYDVERDLISYTLGYHPDPTPSWFANHIGEPYRALALRLYRA